jgi:hypothetical protein
LWILIAYRFHQRLIDLVTGGYEATRREQPRLWDLLETLCISRGITMPKLKIMDSDALNAFATGMNPQQYSITVTQGLIQTLEDAELEAVLGHELNSQWRRPASRYRSGHRGGGFLLCRIDRSPLLPVRLDVGRGPAAPRR